MVRHLLESPPLTAECPSKKRGGEIQHERTNCSDRGVVSSGSKGSTDEIDDAEYRSATHAGPGAVL